MRRVPLLSGSRLVFVPVSDEDQVILPPRPPEHLVDTGAAVRDALRFPLTGPPLSELAPRRARATLVVEPPSLPLPGARPDPRQDALAATIEELARIGVSDERVTILVAGGLCRRFAQRELEHLLAPSRARAFRGTVAVHDVESESLRPIEATDRATRVHPALLDADVVVTVTAAETVIDGGPGALVRASDAATVRSMAGATSLLRFAGSPAWQLTTAIESAIAARVPLLGISLVLDQPRVSGRFRGYPHDPTAFDHVLRSPFRRIYSRLPGSVRRAILTDLGRTIGTAAAYAGTPSVAHAEALLRSIELRAARLAEPVEALVLGVPWVGPHLPREPLNPVTSAATAFGHALRLWREAFPVRRGGTVVLVHSLMRTFAQGQTDPYHPMFAALAASTDPDTLADAEAQAASDSRLLAAYRDGRICHPLLPFADWADCMPALERVETVIVAGSRDAAAARALGFVPSRSVASALQMAHGLADGRARVGVLLGPPYPSLLVGTADAGG